MFQIEFTSHEGIHELLPIKILLLKVEINGLISEQGLNIFLKSVVTMVALLCVYHLRSRLLEA